MYLTYLWEGPGIPLWRSLQSVGLSARCLRRGLADVSGERESVRCRCRHCRCSLPSTNGGRMSAKNHGVKKHRGGCVNEELRKILSEFHNQGAIAPLLPDIQWMAVKSIISRLMMQSVPKGVYRKTNITECKVFWGESKTE